MNVLVLDYSKGGKTWIPLPGKTDKSWAGEWPSSSNNFAGR
jgi:hypothetical protein